MKPPQIVELYTVTEAAHLMRMGRSTLYRLIRAGRVSYTEDPAGRIRFTAKDIDDNLTAGHRPAVAA